MWEELAWIRIICYTENYSHIIKKSQIQTTTITYRENDQDSPRVGGAGMDQDYLLHTELQTQNKQGIVTSVDYFIQ